MLVVMLVFPEVAYGAIYLGAAQPPFFGGAGYSLIVPIIIYLFGSALFLKSSDKPSNGIGPNLSFMARLISSANYYAFCKLYSQNAMHPYTVNRDK